MGLHLINKSINKMYDWLYDISDNYGNRDLNKALISLRIVLHQLRDNLPLNAAIKFSAQLPLIIRGIYFENWHLQDMPLKLRSPEEFIDSISHDLKIYSDIDPEEAIICVFSTLIHKMPQEEIRKLKNVLPKGIRVFFYKIDSSYEIE